MLISLFYHAIIWPTLNIMFRGSLIPIEMTNDFQVVKSDKFAFLPEWGDSYFFPWGHHLDVGCFTCNTYRLKNNQSYSHSDFLRKHLHDEWEPDNCPVKSTGNLPKYCFRWPLQFLWIIVCSKMSPFYAVCCANARRVWTRFVWKICLIIQILYLGNTICLRAIRNLRNLLFFNGSPDSVYDIRWGILFQIWEFWEMNMPDITMQA